MSYGKTRNSWASTRPPLRLRRTAVATLVSLLLARALRFPEYYWEVDGSQFHFSCQNGACLCAFVSALRSSAVAATLSKIEIRCFGIEWYDSGTRRLVKGESSSRSEELLQEFCALNCQHASAYFDLVIQSGVVQHMHDGMHRSSLGVFGAVNQATDTGMHHRSRAHGTRLNSHEHIALRQAMIPHGYSGLAQGNHFRMSSRIGVGEVAIETPANDSSLMDDDRANRHFTSF